MITWLSMSTIKDIPKSEDVITCKGDACLQDVVDTLNTKSIGAIVIVDDENKVAGIFTERDFLKKIGTNQKLDLKKELIKDYMTPEPKVIKETDRVDYSFGMMRMGRFRHLIIVDEEHRCKGMVSIKDAFYYMCDMTA
jgi:CBS domain-containing protein